MTRLSKVATTALGFLVFATPALAFSNGHAEKTFQGAHKLTIHTVSGDCEIVKSSGPGIRVSVDYTFDDESFEPRMEQRGDEVVISERFAQGSNRGQSRWNVEIPDGMEVEFSSASGNFQIAGLMVNLKVSTASGDIGLKSLNGELKVDSASGDVTGGDISGVTRISTASGDIGLTDADGEFKLSSASGDVKVEKVTATERSSFSTASGDVNVVLGKAPGKDLSVSSASGNVRLGFNGNEPQGTLVLRSGERASVHSDFPVDHQETESRWGGNRVIRTTDFGAGPQIELSSASGSITVNQ